MYAVIFDLPATYHICVSGSLDEVWSDRLGGMKITRGTGEGGKPITRLDGELTDQAAVIGILQGLYTLGFVLLSVEREAGD